MDLIDEVLLPAIVVWRHTALHQRVDQDVIVAWREFCEQAYNAADMSRDEIAKAPQTGNSSQITRFGG